MTILRTIPEHEAEGVVAEAYAEDLADYGYVAGYTKVMMLNPALEEAFTGLIRAAKGRMDARRYELVTLAAARAIGSAHCRLAHGRKSLDTVDTEELLLVARDHHDAGLSAAEVAMMDFAERLSGDAATMTEDDAATLRDHGFSDREILDIAAVAAARNFYSRLILSLGVEVQVPPGLTPELRDALLPRR